MRLIKQALIVHVGHVGGEALENILPIYSVSQKKLYPQKFKLSITYCSNLIGLTASN